MSLYDEIVEAELPPGFSTWKEYYASKEKAKKHHKPVKPVASSVPAPKPSPPKPSSVSDIFNLAVRQVIKALTGREPWLVFPHLTAFGYEASFKEGGKIRIEPDRSGQGFFAKLTGFPKHDSYFKGSGTSIEGALTALRPAEPVKTAFGYPSLTKPAPKPSTGQQTTLFGKPEAPKPSKAPGAGYDWDALLKGLPSSQATVDDWDLPWSGGSSYGSGGKGWSYKAAPLPPPKPLTPEQKKLHNLVDPIRKNPLKRQAAGGIVVKDFSAPSVEDIEILVAKTHPKWGSYWVIPKGGADIDEKIHDTASREVREETGVEAKVVDDTPWSRSSTFGDSGKYDLPLILKTLKDAYPAESEFIDSMADELKSMSFTWENHSSYFVMQHTGGEPMSEPDENEEMAFATWMPIHEAIKLPRVGEVVENLLPTIERLWQAQQTPEGPMEASLFSRVIGRRPEWMTSDVDLDNVSIVTESIEDTSTSPDEDYRKWFYGFGDRDHDQPDLTDFDRGIYPPEAQLGLAVVATEAEEFLKPSKEDIDLFNQKKAVLTKWEHDFFSDVYKKNVAKGYSLSPKQFNIYIVILKKMKTAGPGGKKVLSAPKFKPSAFQAAIFDWVKKAAAKLKAALIVDAKAGSGKTATIEAALSFIPETQSVVFLAFNKHIAEELEKRVSGISRIAASTVNSFGWAACRRAFGSGIVQPKMEKNKVRAIIRSFVTEKDEKKRYLADAEKLVLKRKLSADRDSTGAITFPDWETMAKKFGVKLDNPEDPKWNKEKLFQIAQTAWDKSLADLKNFDFPDQVLMPVLHGLPLLHPSTGKKPDWAMVDECQDLCPTERLMVEKISPRTVSVGDPNQSIYAFKGADPDSMNKLRAGLKADELPLSICYRCSKAVIAEAQQIVPGIMAAPNAIEGSVGWIDHTELLDEVKPGNYVLCRTTAPLVKECMKMLAQGRKATVKGKDIGKSLAGLIDLILKQEKMNGSVQISEFYEAMKHWIKKEKERLEGQDEEDIAQGLDDKVEAIFALTAGAQSPDEAMAKIDLVFSDEGGKDGVVFSTVHKAKGMEADDVFIIQPDLMPHLKAKGEIAEQQEENIRYVAITRAKKNLRWVTPPPKFKNAWESRGTSGVSLFERVTGQIEAAEDQLPGGKGDDLKPSDVDPLELAMGVDVEMEHTKSKALATEIALDHLAEDPKYYSKLKKIHKD